MFFNRNVYRGINLSLNSVFVIEVWYWYGHEEKDFVTLRIKADNEDAAKTIALQKVKQSFKAIIKQNEK